MSQINKEIIVSQLKAAGVKEGDTLFLRISYKSVGHVDGGPKTVIEALLEAVGESGTLVATAFPRRIYSFERFYKRSVVVSDSMHLESNVGVIPKMMENYPDAHYSHHATYPFIILGHNARDISEFHTNDKSPYSIISYISSHYNAKCLRIGGRVFTGTTHVSFSDALNNTNNFQRDLVQGLWVLDTNGKKVWQGDNVAIFCPESYEAFYCSKLKEKVELFRGPLGEGEMVITSMRATLELERELLNESPETLLCSNPDCINCRTSYSFSDTSVPGYLLRQILQLIRGEKAAGRRIKVVLMRLLFGKPRV